jgi:hypothetical protein
MNPLTSHLEKSCVIKIGLSPLAEAMSIFNEPRQVPALQIREVHSRLASVRPL